MPSQMVSHSISPGRSNSRVGCEKCCKTNGNTVGDDAHIVPFVLFHAHKSALLHTMKIESLWKGGVFMQRCVIVYSSISVVHRARKQLKQKKVRTAVVQLPSDLGLKGCSYGLECATADCEGILAYSAEKQMPVKAVFHVTESEDGRVYTAYDLS